MKYQKYIDIEGGLWPICNDIDCRQKETVFKEFVSSVGGVTGTTSPAHLRVLEINGLGGTVDCS